ncbi:SAM-dependent methyltransferase [Nonomuraea sp. NPDC050556]|uniref:SAM-dependent methyltransferase n=1 Tax=Nonomuraea sp. NPDC050556 TaxID=3364369 RepID=UPI0037AD322D
MTEGVRLTSDWMAIVRRNETAHPDAYHRDPCATAFVTPESEASMAAFPADPPSMVVPIRARLGDETLLMSGVRQAVCLGAGSDARPYRLPVDHDLHYFDVDLPGHLAGKAELLAAAGFRPRCRIADVEADLRGDWASPLLAAGFDPSVATHWIADGLFYYLTPGEADTLMDTLSALAAAGSWLTFDAPHDSFMADPALAGFHAAMRARGAEFVGSFADPVGWLARRGWRGQAVTTAELSMGRCAWLPPLPARLRTNWELWLARATIGTPT